MPIKPTRDQIKRLAESDLDGPVVMLNLLRYEKVAKTDANAEMISGEASYQRYGEEMRDIMASRGIKLLWRGRADSVVIGDDDVDAWDEVLLVEYPSRKAFLEMAGSKEYDKVGEHRTAALVDSRLLATTQRYRATE
jgi:uncharacterized protein (DUF1330 family)